MKYDIFHQKFSNLPCSCFSLPFSSFHLLSSPLISVSFKYGYQRKMSAMQYLASSPRHMPTHTNMHKKGSNPHIPLLSWITSPANSKAKKKKRFAPIHPVIPPLIPNCFAEVGRSSLRQILIKSKESPSWFLVYATVCMRCKARHIYCSFFCVGHCGVTHPDTISTLLCSHLPPLAAALIAQQET